MTSRSFPFKRLIAVPIIDSSFPIVYPLYWFLSAAPPPPTPPIAISGIVDIYFAPVAFPRGNQIGELVKLTRTNFPVIYQIDYSRGELLINSTRFYSPRGIHKVPNGKSRINCSHRVKFISRVPTSTCALRKYWIRCTRSFIKEFFCAANYTSVLERMHNYVILFYTHA